MTDILTEAQQITDGDKISRILTSHSDGMIFKQSVERDVNGNEVALNFKVNLENVPIEKIRESAAEHLVIRWIRKQGFNKMSLDELINQHGEVLDPMNFQPERKAADPKAKARNAMKKLDADVLAELMQELKDEAEKALME